MSPGNSCHRSLRLRQTAVPFFLESNWKGPHWDIRDALGDHGVTEVLNMMINTWLCSYHPEGPFVPWHYPQQRYNVAVLTRVFNVTR